MVSYREAGVDIELGNKFVQIIKKLAPSAGGFSGLYPLKGTKYYLSASSDGVGTKLKLAFMLNKHNTVGIDLVAMNVNDIICCGAKPLFFLDYFVCSKLNLRVSSQVIKGIHKGCELADCVLLGGETAEMPGFYNKGEYDLAGFAVGAVEKKKVIDGSKVKPGDTIIGLPSSGIHSNGFSLVRKVFSQGELKKYGPLLLTPTRIYVKQIVSMLSFQYSIYNSVHGISHITGGGFYDNIIRILPKNCQVLINKTSWKVPSIFDIIQKKGKVNNKEMYHTFNMGIGMVLIVDKSKSSKVKKLLKGSKIIGEVIKGIRSVKIV